MRLRAVGKLLSYGLASLVGLALVLMLGLKLLLDRAPRYQAEIKQSIYEATGFHVAFARVAPSFRWYGPELYFEKLELRSRDDQRVLARAEGGRVAADVWQLLRRGRLLAGRIELDAPVISVTRLGPDRFSIATDIEFGGESSASGIRAEDLPSGTLAIRRALVTVKDWNEAMPALLLRGVNVDVRHEQQLSLSLTAQLPGALGGDITVRLRSVAGSGELRALPWAGLARLRDMSFDGWRQLLPGYLNGLEAGSGIFNVTAAGQGADIAGAELDFAARGVSMHVPDAPAARLDQISGTLALAHAGNRWSLSGRRMRAARRDPESSFDASWRYGEYGLLDFSIRASYLRAETLLPLTGFLPQKDVREQLRDYAPTGEWTDSLVVMSRSDSQGPWRLQLQGKFRAAGVAAVGGAPGIRGLNGVFAGTENAGHVSLETSGGVYNWPAQLPQPVPLTLKTTLYWRRDGGALLVATPGWQLKTPDVEASGRLAWTAPADGSSPVLTLVGRLQNGLLTGAKNYFPKGLLAPSALEWLKRAFISGRMPQADLLLNGPVRRFPFRDGSGLFLARVTLKDLTLDYADQWAPAEEVSAVAEFRNEGLTVRASAGRIGPLPVSQAEARFADFATGELRIKASAHGDAAQALAYLRDTPLDAMAENAFSEVDAGGALDASCDLYFPFKEFARRRTLVHGHLSGASIGKVGWSPRATQVSGDFDVDGAQVPQADLRGRLLGGPFQVLTRAPRNRAPTRTQLEVRGTLNATELRRSLQMPESIDFSGDTDWRAVLKMAPDPLRERSVRVSSTLEGIELRLPAPLNKPAGTPLPSYVEIQWPGYGGPQGMLALGSLVSGSFALASPQEAYRLTRLTLNFGEGEAGAADPQILNVGGSVQRVDLSGWLNLDRGGKGGKPLSYYLRQATLNIAEIDYLGLAFRDVRVSLATQDNGLRVTVGGPNVSGTITVPNVPADSWHLQFDRLRIGVAESDDGSDAAQVSGAIFSGPRAIPPLSFHAGQLTWGERRFGEVQATLVRLDDGVRLQELSATGPSFGVRATGEWRGRDAGEARIVGSFSSTDIQATLKDLGYADVMEAKSGKINFDLNWTGPPTSRALAGAGGKVALSFDKGQIVGLKPGAGRVLGLTSIAALRRRLSLDFSDLTDKGLAFDTVRGDFEIREGNAYTDNVLLKGPAAEIGLIGRVGLKNRDYDQTAVVTGNIPTSTLPLAALVGGPVVAGAVLVFTQVFKQPLKGLARGYYRITGGWDNPSVERIKGAEAAAATAEAPR